MWESILWLYLNVYLKLYETKFKVQPHTYSIRLILWPPWTYTYLLLGTLWTVTVMLVKLYCVIKNMHPNLLGLSSSRIIPNHMLHEFWGRHCKNWNEWCFSIQLKDQSFCHVIFISLSSFTKQGIHLRWHGVPVFFFFFHAQPRWSFYGTKIHHLVT